MQTPLKAHVMVLSSTPWYVRFCKFENFSEQRFYPRQEASGWWFHCIIIPRPIISTLKQFKAFKISMNVYNKLPNQRHWRHSCAFRVISEQIPCILNFEQNFFDKAGGFSDRKPIWSSKSPSKYLRKLNDNPKEKYMFRITNKILD